MLAWIDANDVKLLLQSLSISRTHNMLQLVDGINPPLGHRFQLPTPCSLLLIRCLVPHDQSRAHSIGGEGVVKERAPVDSCFAQIDDTCKQLCLFRAHLLFPSLWRTLRRGCGCLAISHLCSLLFKVVC